MNFRKGNLRNRSSFGLHGSASADRGLNQSNKNGREVSSFKNLIIGMRENRSIGRSTERDHFRPNELLRMTQKTKSPLKNQDKPSSILTKSILPQTSRLNTSNLDRGLSGIPQTSFKAGAMNRASFQTYRNSGRPAMNMVTGKGETSGRNKIQSVLTSGGSARQSEFYISLSENTARVVGIAAFSLFSGSVMLYEAIDNCLYENTISFLHSIKPKVILIRKSHGPLAERLENEFPDSKLEILEGFHFNETKGMEIYYQICKNKVVQLEDRQYISLAALSCLFSYFLEGDEFFIEMSKLRVEHYEIRDYLVVNNDTARHLELITNNLDKKSEYCLFDCFSCVTYGGGRSI